MLKKSFIRTLCMILILSFAVALSGCELLDAFQTDTDTVSDTSTDSETETETETETDPAPETETLAKAETCVFIIREISDDGKIVKVEVESSHTRYESNYGKFAYVKYADEYEKYVGREINITYSAVELPTEEGGIPTIYAEKISEVYYNAKPVIYLYPETPTECSVKVDLNGELTCTYPEHGKDGWSGFTAHPDGTLVFPDGDKYYCLYWEGKSDIPFDFSKGFCVKGEDTAEFLEWALEAQGLSYRESNEFIIYWLPLMQENEYNVISFQTEIYTENARLEISPMPDSLLRVYMAFYAAEEPVEIEEQDFVSFERNGFTVVEWGGSKVA